MAECYLNTTVNGPNECPGNEYPTTASAVFATTDCHGNPIQPNGIVSTHCQSNSADIASQSAA